MILGVGLDVTELTRIRTAFDRFGRRFAARILAAEELRNLPANDPAPFLAARFAAKEAAAKALGTGFTNGVGLRDIAVRNLPSGAPTLVLSGRAGERAASLGVARTHVSLTHGRDVAAAVVVLEGAEGASDDGTSPSFAKK